MITLQLLRLLLPRSLRGNHRPSRGGRIWRPCYRRNSLLSWSLTHSLNRAMWSDRPPVYRALRGAVTHPPGESRAARIIRFTTAESIGHAATSRASSESLSATDISRSQPFSGVSVATICATKLEKPLFSRDFRRSTEPKGLSHSRVAAGPPRRGFTARLNGAGRRRTLVSHDDQGMRAFRPQTMRESARRVHSSQNGRLRSCS